MGSRSTMVVRVPARCVEGSWRNKERYFEFLLFDQWRVQCEIQFPHSKIFAVSKKVGRPRGHLQNEIWKFLRERPRCTEEEEEEEENTKQHDERHARGRNLSGQPPPAWPTGATKGR